MSGKSELILALAGLVKEVNGLVKDKLDDKDAKIKRLEKELEELKR
jgi:energy-coupling factor transporter ATP-binding protein EcfA2